MFAREWRPGEHVAAVGTTGSGKSTVLFELAKIVGDRRAKDGRPRRVIVIATKRRDRTISKLAREEGWHIIKAWPPSYGQEHAIVWPRGGDLSERPARQHRVLRPLLDRVHDEGGQTVVIDEEAYLEDPPPDGLGLRGMMGHFWREARSSDLDVFAATQRPRNVTRLMWSESAWLVVMQLEDEDDLKRVAQMSGQRDAVLGIVPMLGGHELLCVRRQRDGGRGLYVTRVDLRRGGTIRKR
jgi:energy-coupling factor transporter ATP-binding protein EcfA2